MLEQIERLMIGLKDVSSNVAHDLKTPLTRMRARVESALRGDSQDDYRAALEQTIRESEQLLKTFDALLSIARTESGQSREMFQPVDAGPLVADVAELYQPTLEEAGGSLTLSVADGLYVLADRQLLAQAVSNLVDNAIKYGVADTAKAARIDVRVESGEGSVTISVGDHGLGVPEADRVRVLDRFVRLDEDRSKPGNGLGLSLVSGIMRLHGGTIRLLDNEPGLRVELVFPAHKAQA
jgi:signal transduction histidine kinase